MHTVARVVAGSSPLGSSHQGATRNRLEVLVVSAMKLSEPLLPHVGAIVVHYRGVAETLACVRHLPEEVSVAVVDNSGEGDLLRNLLSDRPHVQVLGEGRNVGFGAAANVGALATERDLLLFVNPDARPCPEDLQAMAARLAADDGLAAVAPALVDERGAVQTDGGGWFPSPRRAINQSLLARYAGTRGVWLRPTGATTYPVEWLTGACLLVRSDAFRAVDGFSPEYVLYNEDMDLGRKLGLAGWRLILDATRHVPHVGGGSAGASYSVAVWRLRGGSLGYYVTQHASSPLQARATKIAFAVGFLLRAAGYGAARRRTRASEMLTYASSVLAGRRPSLT